eukprot:TRINITY_DN23515_c0_g1_i1.p1 TRINITY_DN23515_c0_g1~~TRINITY_DN23515_c0_g1_i1.p1  ORF type:complete len:161 (-),score=13.17 TRINITY_DN23515_c0_g1_i1:38-520(-)
MESCKYICLNNEDCDYYSFDGNLLYCKLYHGNWDEFLDSCVKRGELVDWEADYCVVPEEICDIDALPTQCTYCEACKIHPCFIPQSDCQILSPAIATAIVSSLDECRFSTCTKHGIVNKTVVYLTYDTKSGRCDCFDDSYKICESRLFKRGTDFSQCNLL